MSVFTTAIASMVGSSLVPLNLAISLRRSLQLGAFTWNGGHFPKGNATTFGIGPCNGVNCAEIDGTPKPSAITKHNQNNQRSSRKKSIAIFIYSQTPRRSSASTYWFALMCGSLLWLVILNRRFPPSGKTLRFEDEGEVFKACPFGRGASELFPEESCLAGPDGGFELEGEAIIDFDFSKRCSITGDDVGTALAEL